MEEACERHRSNIVLALDLTIHDPKILLSKSLEILEKVSPHICAVKVNRQLVLPLGLYAGVKKVVEFAHTSDLPAIMDCKINDVGHTNREIIRHYYDAGFDAVTANPFVGWEGGLRPVFESAREAGRGVILLVYMSHKGAHEGYGQQVIDPETGRKRSQYLVFAKKALEWRADGAVVGATYPDRMREVHSILGDKVPIYSPGVILQGGKLEDAIKAGATYIIIGRAICNSANPPKIAGNFKERANEIFRVEKRLR